MEGVYLDGNLKLKKPTYTSLLRLGLLLDEHGLEKVATNKALAVRALRQICTKEKGYKLNGKLTPILTAKIIIDFFSIYFNKNIKDDNG